MLECVGGWVGGWLVCEHVCLSVWVWSNASPSPSQHLDMEEDTKSLKGQLLAVCPSLENTSLDGLLSIWSGVRVRMFMHYQLSARAYFTFLKLSGSQAGSSPGERPHPLSVE